jgi:hypothetical protein
LCLNHINEEKLIEALIKNPYIPQGLIDKIDVAEFKEGVEFGLQLYDAYKKNDGGLAAFALVDLLVKGDVGFMVAAKILRFAYTDIHYECTIEDVYMLALSIIAISTGQYWLMGIPSLTNLPETCRNIWYGEETTVKITPNGTILCTQYGDLDICFPNWFFGQGMYDWKTLVSSFAVGNYESRIWERISNPALSRVDVRFEHAYSTFLQTGRINALEAQEIQDGIANNTCDQITTRTPVAKSKSNNKNKLKDPRLIELKTMIEQEQNIDLVRKKFEKLLQDESIPEQERQYASNYLSSLIRDYENNLIMREMSEVYQIRFSTYQERFHKIWRNIAKSDEKVLRMLEKSHIEIQTWLEYERRGLEPSFYDLYEHMDPLTVLVSLINGVSRNA